MPIFNYECECGEHKQELVKKYDDKVKCDCGKVMTKLIGVPSLGGMDKLGRSK